MMKEPINAYFVISGKYHDLDFARLEILKLLAEHDHIRTTVAPNYLDTDAIAASDFLISFTVDVAATPEQTKVLQDYVSSGKKWVALHGTNSILAFREDGLVDAPDDAPDFMELLGTQFVAHPPIGPFKVEVVNDTDPLTKGITDFEVVDELYLSRTTADIDILMQTRFGGEATGFVEDKWEDDTIVPIAYTRKYGDGEVFYCTLGHSRSHYDVREIMPFYVHPERCSWNYPVYYEILRRSIRWAIGTL